MNDQGWAAKMQLYLCSLVFLLLLAEYASSTTFTADVDPSLRRHLRCVNSAAVLTPLSLNVVSQISSRFANTLVTSVLENKSPRNQEAKFVVQLPETAFISNFSMVVNEKHYIGKVKEKNALSISFPTSEITQSSKTHKFWAVWRYKDLNWNQFSVELY